MTPLHWASINGHLNVVEYLVNHNADIQSKTRTGQFKKLMALFFI